MMWPYYEQVYTIMSYSIIIIFFEQGTLLISIFTVFPCYSCLFPSFPILLHFLCPQSASLLGFSWNPFDSCNLLPGGNRFCIILRSISMSFWLSIIYVLDVFNPCWFFLWLCRAYSLEVSTENQLFFPNCICNFFYVWIQFTTLTFLIFNGS